MGYSADGTQNGSLRLNIISRHIIKPKQNYYKAQLMILFLMTIVLGSTIVFDRNRSTAEVIEFYR